MLKTKLGVNTLANCSTIMLTEEFKQISCDTISGAIEKNSEIFSELHTENGRAITFWDAVCTTLAEKLHEAGSAVNCERFLAKRGNWEFSIVYYDGNILIFMREKRFEDIKKQFEKDSKIKHYLPNLAKVLNIDIPLMQDGLFMFENDESKEQAETITNNVLKNVYEKHEYIKRFGVILFDADKENLYSIRLVVINGALEICAEEDFSNHIRITTPVVTNDIKDNPKDNYIDPGKGLKLTGKAMDKKVAKEQKFRRDSHIENANDDK